MENRIEELFTVLNDVKNKLIIIDTYLKDVNTPERIATLELYKKRNEERGAWALDELTRINQFTA